MEISPIQLLFLFLYSCFFGGVLGLLHDLNQLVRMMLGGPISSHGKKLWYETRLPLIGRPLRYTQAKKGMQICLSGLTFFQDVFLFLAAGAGTVILNYYLNDGRFRIYTVLGIAIGFTLYRLTLKRIILPMGEYILFCLLATCGMAFYILSYPFLFFVRFVLFILEFLFFLANRRETVI